MGIGLKENNMGKESIFCLMAQKRFHETYLNNNSMGFGKTGKY